MCCAEPSGRWGSESRHREAPGQVPDRECLVLAPTFLEYLAARRAAPSATVVRSGVGLATWRGSPQGSTIVVCGLAGGLRAGLAPGTVLIPREVGSPGGQVLACDAELTDRLVSAARRLGYDPVEGRLLTAPALVTGPDREDWANRGFVAADMETGLLAGRGYRVATVRVVLDSADRPIAEDWVRAGRAVLHPGLWRELVWMGRFAPTFAFRAARVLGSALNEDG